MVYIAYQRSQKSNNLINDNTLILTAFIGKICFNFFNIVFFKCYIHSRGGSVKNKTKKPNKGPDTKPRKSIRSKTKETRVPLPRRTSKTKEKTKSTSHKRPSTQSKNFVAPLNWILAALVLRF